MIELEQDRQEVEKAPIVVSTIVVLSVIVLSLLVVYVFTWASRGHLRLRTDAVHWWRDVPEDVRGVELRNFQEETKSERAVQDARKHLAEYGWMNREAGRIFVPIDVAMDIYLAEHDTP